MRLVFFEHLLACLLAGWLACLLGVFGASTGARLGPVRARERLLITLDDLCLQAICRSITHTFHTSMAEHLPIHASLYN